MTLCNTWGIAHSAFLTWDPDDQDKALAKFDLDRRKCSMCGTFDDEWVDEKGRFLDPPLLEPLPFICHGCEARELLQSSIRPGPNEEEHFGERVVIVPFDPERDVVDEVDRRAAHEAAGGYQPPLSDPERLPSY